MVIALCSRFCVLTENYPRMMNIRVLGKIGLALLLASSVSACLTGSGGGAASDSVSSAIDSVSVSITSPTSSTAIDTTDELITLAGNATSQVGISQVIWNNDRGGQGVANGTDSWLINDIALQFGTNKITVTAEDNAGAKSSQSISIFRESGQAGTVTLSWTAPTARTDGVPLNDLRGYKIYYGRMSGIYDYLITINNSGVVTYVVENLIPGDWYFAMTAYDSDGLESVFSNEVVTNVD
jgi:hypothetical protein